MPRLRALFLQKFRDESGMGLIIALGITIVMSISVTTSIYYTSTNSRSTTRSSADQKALQLAEAGMNNAISILNGASTYALSTTAIANTCCATSPGCASPASPTLPSCQVYGEDTSYWWGTLSANKWTVYGKGVVKNPGSADVVRQVQTDVTVLASPTQNYNAQAWEYVISTGYAGNTTNCDQQLSGGGQGGNAVTIGTRLYVFGNLCIGVTGQGQAVLTAANSQIRGRVYINEGSIGTSSLSVGGLHVGGGCKYQTGTFHTSCTSTDHVWSNPLSDSTVDMTIAAPTADFTTSSSGYYNNASPGPKFPCTTSTGTVPVFESANNTAVDNSVPGYFELTPSGSTSDYSCKTSLGEISWNHTTRTLTVIGTIFIDGSAKISTSGIVNYAGPSTNGGKGAATLYLTGTFLMASGTKFCAQVPASPNNTDCDWANWVPNGEMFGVVAHGSGGQNPTGVGIWINNASFQGALFSDNKIRVEQNATTQGPMIGSEVQLGYGLSSGTQTNYGFPVINTIPSGFPGVPNTHAQPQPPTAFSG